MTISVMTKLTVIVGFFYEAPTLMLPCFLLPFSLGAPSVIIQYSCKTGIVVNHNNAGFGHLRQPGERGAARMSNFIFSLSSLIRKFGIPAEFLFCNLDYILFFF